MQLQPEFAARYGPWSFIAGASEGIGAAFAKGLAARGLNLVLVARREGPLNETAAALRAEYGVEVRTHSLDLSAPDLLPKVKAITNDLEVGLLVYNAALSRIGTFLAAPLEDRLQEVNLNVRGPLTLSHHFAGKMVARGRGGVILMSSASGFQGTAMIANYAATKAYNTVLGEGLWYELQRKGVDVLSFVAGATSTPSFLQNTETMPQNFLARPMQAEEAAEQALRDLGKKPRAVAGLRNQFASLLLERLLPKQRAIRMVSKETLRLFRSSQ